MSYKIIRENFLFDFRSRLKDYSIEEERELGKVPFEEDDYIHTWYNEKLQRAIRIQQNDLKEDKNVFACYLDTRGEDFEIDEVVIITFVEEQANIDRIFELYKYWFVDKKNKNEMDEILKQYNIKK